MATGVGLVVLKAGSTLTFRSPRYVTFAAKSLALTVNSYQVLKDCIAFKVVDAICERLPDRRSIWAWNAARVNIGRCVELLAVGSVALEGTSGGW